MRRNRHASADNRSRTGFTLIELMVAMALSLFLMTILAEAFAVSMDTFRGLRAIGDMQDTLRNALRQMREDLSLPHFEGARKLSDNGFWTEPRREGFFYARGTPMPTNGPGWMAVNNPPGTPLPPGSTIGPGVTVVCANEGVDANGVQSSRATDHVLHFAVRRHGSRPTNFFKFSPTAPPVPNPRYTPGDYSTEAFYGSANGVSSQWSEVAYVLRPMPGNPAPTTPETTSSPAPIPLYNLYRAQVLVLPYRDSIGIGGLGGSSTAGVSNGTVLLSGNPVPSFLSPNDLALTTVDSNRGFKGASTNVALNSTQVSLVCSNVVSFQIRVIANQRSIVPALPVPQSALFTDPVNSMNLGLYEMQSFASGANPGDPAVDGAAVSIPGWANPAPATQQSPPQARILGVQIKLRIYDPASGQSRQSTLVQAL